MDKRKQLQIVNDLLDQCGDCPKRRMVGTPDRVCGGCDLYHKIREAGQPLWGDEVRRGRPSKNFRFELDKGEYFRMRDDDLSDEDIAYELDVSARTIWQWKKRNGIHTKPKSRKMKLDKVSYEQLVSEGITITEICKILKVSRSTLLKWRKQNGYAIQNQGGAAYSDEEVLQAIIDNKSYFWIQKHLRAGVQRVKRIAAEHGITR